MTGIIKCTKYDLKEAIEQEFNIIIYDDDLKDIEDYAKQKMAFIEKVVPDVKRPDYYIVLLAIDGYKQLCMSRYTEFRTSIPYLQV